MKKSSKKQIGGTKSSNSILYTLQRQWDLYGKTSTNNYPHPPLLEENVTVIFHEDKENTWRIKDSNIVDGNDKIISSGKITVNSKNNGNNIYKIVTTPDLPCRNILPEPDAGCRILLNIISNPNLSVEQSPNSQKLDYDSDGKWILKNPEVKFLPISPTRETEGVKINNQLYTYAKTDICKSGNKMINCVIEVSDKDEQIKSLLQWDSTMWILKNLKIQFSEDLKNVTINNQLYTPMLMSAPFAIVIK